MDPTDTAVITSWTWSDQAVNSFYDVPLAIQNSGASTATLVSVSAVPGPFSFKGGSWPGTDGDCPPLGTGTLTAGGFCHVILRYSPTSIGQNNANLTLTYFNGQAQSQVPLGLFGTSADAPFLTISDSPTGDDPLGHNFGTVLIGQNSGPLTLYVDNLGSEPATTIVATPLSAPFAYVGGSYPGTGTPNPCGSSLAAGASCTLSVVYTPTSPVFVNEVLKLTYSNGAWAAPAYLALSGTGAIQQTPPNVVIAPVVPQSGCTAGACFGTAPLGSAVTLTFNVTNTGSEPATSLSPGAFQTGAFNWAGGTFPGNGGTAGTAGTCATGQLTGSCTIVVTFTPNAAAAFNDTISLGYGPDNDTATLSLTGNGIAAAALSISPSSGSCSAPAGYHCSMTFTVTNPAGASTATSVAASITGPSNFTKTSDTCTSAGSLLAGASCSIGAQFSPAAGMAGVGSTSATLSLAYNSGAGPTTATAALTGTGTPQPYLVPSSTSDSFGTQTVDTTSAAKTITLTYYGADPAILSYAYASSPSAFSLPAGGTIPGSSSFSVTFTPPTTGALSDTLILSYSDATTGQSQTAIDFSMSGTGGGPLSVSGSSTLSFGNVVVGTSYTKTLTLTDSSGQSVSGLGATLSGTGFSYLGGSYPGTGGTCGTSTSSSCTVVLAFTPAIDASASGSLKFTYSADSQTMPTITVNLSGTGIPPLSISPSSLSFGTLLEGTSSSASAVTISFASGNGGSATSATIGAISAPSGYSISRPPSGGCPLSGGAITSSCAFDVTFSPTAASSYSGTISITDTTSGGTLMNTLLKVTLSGAGGAPANLGSSLSHTFGATPVDQSSSYTFTFTNSGGVPATGITVGAVSAPFTITSDSCAGASVAAGASCSVTIEFSPTTSPGPFSGTFTVNYNNGSAAESVTASFSGTSSTSGALAVTGSSTSFGSVPMGASPVTRTFTVTNNGTATATGIGAGATPTGNPFSYPGGFPGTGGTCTNGGSLAVSASCTIVIQFNPSSPGNFSDSIVVAYNTGSAAATTAPLAITGSSTVTPQITVNGNHTCVIQSSGQLVCFGRNNVGQLGIGSNTDQGNPSSNTDGVIDASLSGLTAVNFGSGHWPRFVAAGYWHTCAILDDHSVRCWGHNDQGQLGYGNTTDLSAPSSTPVNLGTGKTAVTLALGYSHSCAILNDGTLKCWGNNTYGELGLGDANNRGDNSGEMGDSLPAVSLAGTPTQISANAGDTCALLSGGSVQCWGDNFYGELGQGNDNSVGGAPNQMGTNLPPINLGTGKTAVQIAAGGGYTCAVLNDASIKCWGQNESSSSVYAANPNGYTGSTGTCWALDNNSDSGPCWNAAYPDQTRGYGIAAGQMGDDLPAVSLPTGLTAVSVTTGNLHTCALLSDGSTRCWGDNQLFELGATPGDSTPGPNRGINSGDMGSSLPSLSGAWGESVAQLVSGGAHTCALLSNGSLQCWGTIQSSQ